MQEKIIIARCKNIVKDPKHILYLLVSFIVGFATVLMSWVIDLSSLCLPLNSANIAKIHSLQKSLYLVDTLPFLFLTVTFAVIYLYLSKIDFYKNSLQEKEDRINKNANIAKQIGEGNFNINIDKNENDILTMSLLRMKDNLLKNSESEAEQSWIATGRDQISTILRLHNNLEELAYETIQSLIQYINAIQGAFYFFDEDDQTLKNIATYAYNRKKYVNQKFNVGQGLVGQVAYEMASIYRTEIPDFYVTITSGILGDKRPSSLLIVPLISDDKLQGVIEFASLDSEIPELKIKFIEQLSSIIAQTVFNLKVNSRTERLLTDAQKMTQELKENEEELKQNAEEMKATHDELEKTNTSLEEKITEVENAQKRMHALLENASEIITIYDKNLKMIYISPSVSNILGYTPEEIMDGRDEDRQSTKGQQDLALLFENILENPTQKISIQYTYLRKDNQKIYIESTGRNFINDPAIQGIVLNSQDITARKKAEQEERMKSKMQALSENSLDMIIRISLNAKFYYMNPVFEKLTGIPVRDAINKGIEELQLPVEVSETYRKIINDIKNTKEKTNIEAHFPSSSGDTRIMAIDAIPEFGEDKELETILIVAHDITEQKEIENEIKEKNKAITESINYAYRIQSAILPDLSIIKEKFPKSFMFYKPRDVVSGDFPWFFAKGDNVYIAVVDCTGHGVPGALLSFIGYFLLNNIVDHDEDLSAGEICDRLHTRVRSTLKQDREDANARDGMDIAFLKVNFSKMEIQYAGAHRPLIHQRGSEMFEYKGDRKAIGGIPHLKKEEKNFENYVIPINEGDKFFFFSDGLPDQVGGEDGRKYQAKRIREAVEEHPDYSMSAFLSYFKKDFLKWKGDFKQIDDVLLIGIEI